VEKVLRNVEKSLKKCGESLKKREKNLLKNNCIEFGNIVFGTLSV
jgi:hypothetical protein